MIKKSLSSILITLFLFSVAGCKSGDIAARKSTLEPKSDYIIKVPGDFTTIQEAIYAAKNGATVLVDDGTYEENINFRGKAITIQSVNGAKSTIINGGGQGSVVTINSKERGAVIDGFMITNGTGTMDYETLRGGGIFCKGSSVTIRNCIITDNTADSVGGGIYLGHNSSAIVTGCLITGNTGVKRDSYGGGIGFAYATVKITNCEISNNSVQFMGAGIYSCGSKSTITDCNIINNSGGTQRLKGGGIINASRSTMTITASTISGNSAVQGGGIYTGYGKSHLVASDSTITGNTASAAGGGTYLDCNNSTSSFTNSNISGNVPDDNYHNCQ